MDPGLPESWRTEVCLSSPATGAYTYPPRRQSQWSSPEASGHPYGKADSWLSTVMKFLVELTCRAAGVLGFIYPAQYPDGLSRC